MDPLIPRIVAALLVVVSLALLLRRFRQPLPVVYIVTGVALGPQGLGLIEDREVLARMGEYGVLLLLFFLGMEVSLPNLLQEWKVPVLGTAAQVVASVGLVLAVGSALGWPWQRGLLLGFVISLSSTAVVLKVLEERGELSTNTGRDVVSILVAQDLALAPMLLVLGAVAGEAPSSGRIVFQLIVAALLLAIAVSAARATDLRLPFGPRILRDHELQIFVALLCCLGFALISGIAGLSTAFGAFVAGLVIGGARETDWVQRSLDPFRVVFVAAFLMSVGAVLDVSFLRANLGPIAILTLAAFVTNFAVNGLILRALGRGWGRSVYGAALLAQVGEFGFVLAAVGLQAGIVTGYGYQLTISVIAVSLLLAPAWVLLFQRFGRRAEGGGGLPTTA